MRILAAQGQVHLSAVPIKDKVKKQKNMEAEHKSRTRKYMDLICIRLGG